MKNLKTTMKTCRFRHGIAEVIRGIAVTAGMLLTGVPDAWAQERMTFGTMLGLMASMAFMAWVLWKLAEEVEND